MKRKRIRGGEIKESVRYNGYEIREATYLVEPPELETLTRRQDENNLHVYSTNE